MKLSIVIPFYNLENYVHESVDSILAACEKIAGTEKVQIVCVDDGSTDATAKILDEYSAKVADREDLAFEVVHKPNGGEGSARNAGLERISGDWFMFLDGDDVVSADLLRVVLGAMGVNPQVDILSFGSRQFDDGSAPLFDSELRSSRLVDCRLKIPDALGMIGVWQLVYRREKFGDLRFARYKLGADLVYTSKCFAVADSVLALEFVGHGYRRRMGSALRSKMTFAKALDGIGFREEMFGSLAESGKRLGRVFTQSRGNSWIRDYVRKIDRLPASERPMVFRRWLESLERAKKMPFFSLWQKFSIGLLLTTKSYFVAKLLHKIRVPF